MLVSGVSHTAEEGGYEAVHCVKTEWRCGHWEG